MCKCLLRGGGHADVALQRDSIDACLDMKRIFWNKTQSGGVGGGPAYGVPGRGWGQGSKKPGGGGDWGQVTVLQPRNQGPGWWRDQDSHTAWERSMIFWGARKKHEILGCLLGSSRKGPREAATVRKCCPTSPCVGDRWGPADHEVPQRFKQGPVHCPADRWRGGGGL